MAGRIILLGATGFTGELTARELVRRGARPVLAGRDAARVHALAEQLGGLESATADVTRPKTLSSLVDAGDVLLTCVGPFARWGEPALRAAVAAGAHYIDSTGETPFIRRVFDAYGPGGDRSGVRGAVLTAMGYDWVPGNLAAALALRAAGARATRVDVGYFVMGRGSASGGTRASAAGMVLASSYAWRDGRLVSEPPGRRRRTFPVDGRSLQGISVGATEQLSLPRMHPQLRDVDVFLGWFGAATPVVRALCVATAALARIPGVRTVAQEGAGRLVRGSTGGPDAMQRGRARSLIVAEARDDSGDLLADVQLTGVEPYAFTAGMLAWAAQEAAAGRVVGAGALGPVEAFGVDRLHEGVRSAGIELVS